MVERGPFHSHGFDSVKGLDDFKAGQEQRLVPLGRLAQGAANADSNIEVLLSQNEAAC